MRIEELEKVLRRFDPEAQVHIVLRDDDKVYNEIVTVDQDGTGEVEIIVV